MTDTTPTPTPHRATPEQLLAIYDWDKLHGKGSSWTLASAILELFSRVEALEAQQAQPSQPAAPAEDTDSGLVRQVALAIADAICATPGFEVEARAAIRVVARWLRAEGYAHPAPHLEQEAGR